MIFIRFVLGEYVYVVGHVGLYHVFYVIAL